MVSVLRAELRREVVKPMGPTGGRLGIELGRYSRMGGEW